MGNILLIFLTFVVSFLVTGGIYRYAEKMSLVDIPNARSSHTRPTPRGGGLGIVISFTVSFLYGLFSSSIPLAKPYCYLLSILLIAAIGFWDDLCQISAFWRFPTHLIASFLIVISFQGQNEMVDLLGFDSGRPLAIIVMVIVLTWLLNLYNFMDGIDGIAASEAVFVSIGGAILLFYTGQNQLAGLLLALSAASAGFLLWNWPPAKIFMGDVGSGFVGLALGGIALNSMAASDKITIWPWLILFGVFLVDATYTLVVRLIGGQRWYAAHCSHTYQHAALRFKSHRKVTFASIIINIFWLFPLAFSATKSPEYGMYCSLIAFLPLICMAIFFKAGNSQVAGCF